MNKKLQKGIVAAVSAAMGSGMVAPIYAAAATGTGLDAQYKAAYDATVKATTSKSQKDLTDARVLVDGLYATVKGTANEYLATTLSSLLDPAQQVKLVELMAAFDKADASLKQADINASRDLLIAMPAQWVNAFSSKNDSIQQKLMTKVNDAVVKAEGSKLAADKTAAQALIDDVKTVTNNANVASWATSMQTRLAAVSTEVKVVSVSAIAADTFKVTFNQAVDTSKVEFKVTQASSAVTVSATWNTAKTEATLTKSANFAPGDYVVNVKNNGTDLGNSNLTVSEQKIAKIEVTSSKLGVVTKTTGSGSSAQSTQTGYATYRILDQYGVDITTKSGLTNNVAFQCGVGSSIEAKNGVIKITADNNINLMQFSTIVISGYDSSTGTSISQTLNVTTQLGTLSDIQLDSNLSNADGKTLRAGDSTTVFYIPFKAYDISGNLTTDYNLVKQGLILNSDDGLTVSSQYVTAKVVRDPSDSNKAALEVRTDDREIKTDMQFIITAMTYTGKSSQINLTLKKQAQVSTFTLLAPDNSVASGEEKQIPFLAYDQDGKQITKYEDLVDKVDLSGAYFDELADGTAIVKNQAVQNNGTTSVPAVLTAVVNDTGKYSSITINIQKPVKGDTLAIDKTVLLANMQQANGSVVGAHQLIDLGWDKAGLSVKDQYGRTVDMSTVNNNSTSAGISNDYVILAKSQDSSIVAVNGYVGAGKYYISVDGKNAGSTTVYFKLVAKSELTAKGITLPAADPTTNIANVASSVYDAVDGIDTQSMTMSTIKNDDIKDYTIDSVDPIYTSAENNAADYDSLPTRATDFDANPEVYGTTSTGAKVKLAGTPITGVYVDNNTDFITNNTDVAGAGKSDVAEVVARKFAAGSTKTEASTVMTVTLTGADSKTHSVSTTIKSTNADPVAKTMGMKVYTERPGVSYDNNIITIDLAQASANGFKTGTVITRWNNTTGNNPLGRAPFYLYAKDQYGTKAMQLARIQKVTQVLNADGTTKEGTSSVSDAGFNVNADGTISVDTTQIATNDFAYVTAVATNGMNETVKVKFLNGTKGVTTPASTALAKINAGTETFADFATAGVTGAVNANLAAYNTAIAAPQTYTLAQIQAKIDAVNASVVAAAAAALAKINAGTETFADFATAGVTGAVGANLAAYNTAIAAPQTYTLAQIQAKVDTVNATVAASIALANINAGTETFADFATAGVTGAVGANLVAYNTAIAAPQSYTLAQIQAKVDAVNAFVAVNNATDRVSMRAALENAKLGLDLTTYVTLTESHKNNAAQYMLDTMPSTGYANIAAVNTAFAVAVTK